VTSLSKLISPQFILKSLTNNLGLKSFALLTSILLFSLVHSEEEARRSVLVDVVALLPPARSGKLLVSDLPVQIKVTLKGRRSRIRAMQRDDFLPVQMDISDGTSRYYYFDPASIEVPTGIDVVQVEPTAVPLTWANATEKSVPVRARLTGAFAHGFELRHPAVLTPSEVALRGPESEMRSIYEAPASPVAVDGLGPGKYERLVPLEPLPRNVKCLREMVVRVQFEVVPVQAERVLYHLSVVALGQGKAWFRPSKVTVTVRGPAPVLSQIDLEKLAPVIDLSKLRANAAPQAQPVTLRGLPDGLAAVKIAPPEVLAGLR
jgi:YbbR domain-containing protein